MSLINRIEISNFVCLFGPEAPDNEWSPQFRHNLLNLRSHSAAISMPNGMGKTSLADAVIAVLSRDRTLVTQTREKMAPASGGAYSHIRVELKIPSAGSHNDMLVNNGEEIPGETWVFGICGFRGQSQSMTFYYYKGRLDDCPVAKVDGHRINLLSNADFKQSRENVPGLRFGVSESDWVEAMTPHFPAHSLVQMANFQKNGGGDTASSIYNISRKGNEGYHESFFYSVIAPELMSGAMSGDEDDDGDEHYLESTLMKSGRAYIRAKQETARKEKALERDQQTLTALDLLSTKARKAIESGEETQRLFEKISEEAGVINQLMKRRFVGVPFVDAFPAGKIGDLARGIVVMPEAGPVIQDRVLAKVLGKNTGHLNEFALRSGVKSTQITQPIEIICDSSKQDNIGTESKTGPVIKGYALNQAIELLRDRDADVENVRSAFKWFAEAVDTNPYRRKSQALAQEISVLLAKVEGCKQKAGEANAGWNELEATITRIDSLKDAWKALNEAGCFSEEELADPMATHDLVTSEFSEAKKASLDHESKVDRIQRLQASHQIVINEFGADANPGVILTENNRRLTETKERLRETRGEIASATEQRKEASNQVSTLEEKIQAETKQLGHLQSLASKADGYADLFGSEEPDGLEGLVVKEKDAHLRRQAELRGEIKQAGSLVESLQAFRTQFGDVSPRQWIADAEVKHREYVGQLQDAERQQSDLKRRLRDLENEKVSPSTVSARAMDALVEEGLSCSRLHDVIRNEHLEQAREKQILSYFSALLFSPVFETEEDAAKAARLLYEQDMPIPVFIHSKLADFATNGSLSTGTDGLVYDHQAGVSTRTVECIIDPSRIKREKEEVIARLSALDTEMSEINARLHDVSPTSPSMRLAQRAEEAEKADAESRLESMKEEMEQLDARFELIERRASHDAILLIRSMVEFNSLGGSGELDAVRGRVSELQVEKKVAEESVSRLDQALVTLGEKSKAYEDERDQFTLSPAISVALDKAKEYLDADGPAFLATAQDVAANLKELEKRAEKRNAGELLFKNAAEFLKTRDNDFEQTQAKIQKLKEQEQTLLNEAGSYSERVDEIEAIRNRLSGFESSLDFVAAELLRQHKHIRSLPEVSTESGESSEIVAKTIRFMADIGKSDDTDLEAMNYLKVELENMDIEQNARNARQSEQRYRDAMADLASAVDTAISREALSSSMKTALGMNKESPSEIVAIRERFYVDFEHVKNVFEEAKKTEEKVRSKARETLVEFCDNARDNLKMLQDVLKKGEASTEDVLEKGGATLDVKAKIADTEALGSVVDSIMAVIENEEDHFHKTKDGSRGEEEKYKKGLVGKIRDRIYRGIFSNPMVKILHPDIHGAHASVFSQKMSGGQRTAVSLMVMSVLAEFSMRKESIRNASSYAGRRKAIAKGTSVLIIDGLFSNLSKPSLIQNSMASLKASRGNFQLIGLIHWPQYVNNHDIFPTYIIGKEVADLSNTDGVSGFVYTEDGSTIISPEKIGRKPGELDSTAFHVSR